MIPDAVSAWLEENRHGEVVQTRAVGGGCINTSVRLQTAGGAGFFLKTNSSCPEDMFAKEVAGLEALAVEGGPRVPKPFLHGANFLLMEDLAPAGKAGNYWAVFGRQMAALHQHTDPQFGFKGDNYIGSTPQPNPWTEDGYEFFAKHRLAHQAELARKRGLLSLKEAEGVSRIAARLTDLVPEQPASILHGDLWSGNATTDSEGQPAIIDPAAYYGWAEADLAMMVLFGRPAGHFWQAYQEVRPLEPEWQERFPVYNLYHLLNHLNLFGRGYHGQVISVVRRFS
ncbi:MAG: fructosamine kinase family protein [Anaerolineales bacterium]